MRILTDEEIEALGVLLLGKDEECESAAKGLFGNDISTAQVESRVITIFGIDKCCECDTWYPSIDLNSLFICTTCQEEIEDEPCES
jgi:hypothetical protein